MEISASVGPVPKPTGDTASDIERLMMHVERLQRALDIALRER